MLGAQVHKTGGKKAVVYSAHDSTLLAMQSRMGIKPSATPSFAAHYTFELHEVCAHGCVLRVVCVPTATWLGALCRWLPMTSV